MQSLVKRPPLKDALDEFLTVGFLVFGPALGALAGLAWFGGVLAGLVAALGR